MNLFRLVSTHLSKSYLKYDSSRLIAELEYHVEMAQICEELLAENHVRLEFLGAQK
jgi:hypothetical protein